MAYVRQRITALLIDWLTICVYLLLLAAVAMAIYLLAWGEIPEMTSTQSQLLATITTVIPAVIWYTIKESRTPFASFGKRKQHLHVKYRHNPAVSALVRNVFKFMPWQLGHMGVISGMYNDFESSTSLIIIIASIFLGLTYALQVVVTPSHRHLGDLFAGARVIPDSHD